jgi:hypothetical protein
MGVKGSDIRIAKDDGIQAWPTIISLAESPKHAGVTYAGTDNGHLQVSRDGGRSWTDVADKIPGLPKGIWVSEVVPSRFDEGTVYATFDGHRQNDFETYIYVSHDFGNSWQSASANLKGEVIKTMTEDLKNPDVLYAGAETGLFVSIDRAKSWTRVRANLPTVRIDEITLHPRDNAMILATHGRAIWILDHLEPIQEYAAAQAAASDAKMFTPPPYAMFRRPARDRNYEFWGDQTFFGENPPLAAVVSWLIKRPATNVSLTITDAAGRQVREMSGPIMATAGKPGIQSACWDLRVQPAPAVAGRAGSGGRQAGGAEAQAAGGGGRGTQPTASPFGIGCANPAGGGGGGFGGAGGGNAGPYVLGGVYNVALVLDGKTVATKPLRVQSDPEVVLTEGERKKLFDMAMEIHALQTRAAEAANQLSPFTARLAELTTELSNRNDVPADVKSQVEALSKEASTLGPQLTPPAGFGRGGGGGGRGGAPDTPAARAAQAKNGLMGGMWPTEQTLKAYADAKVQLPKAIADANTLFSKGTALSSSLAKFNVALAAPQPVNAKTAETKK